MAGVAGVPVLMSFVAVKVAIFSLHTAQDVESMGMEGKGYLTTTNPDQSYKAELTKYSP